MTVPVPDLAIELYEKCLMSQDPYTVLGEHLGKELGLFAISVWSAHPNVRDAASRIVFFQQESRENLIQKDQELADHVFSTRGSFSGFHRGLYYRAEALWGTHSHNAVILWSVLPFSNTDMAFLENLCSRLTVLFDVIVLKDSPMPNRVARELESTQFIQRQLMPPLDVLGGKNFLSYRTLPAHELGGDYLDILTYPNDSVGLTVADAMGKGVPGAFLMLMARTIFRLLAKDMNPPHQILTALNKQFTREIADVQAFVTQFYCVYSPVHKALIYANAGHNPPVIYRRSAGKSGVLPGNGIALGGRSDAQYQSHSVKLDSGDILVIFTDGLSDARNEHEQAFGVRGIARTVMKYKEYSADGICDSLVNAVMKHCQMQTDDISLMVLKAD
ncbi:MAG: serine/threonine-protein phosphatase [Firmicutes bacterium]|nr:serine/threonine-protein phosphatase [Bacillota bacterium]